MRLAGPPARRSENELREILVLEQLTQSLRHHRLVHDDALRAEVRRVEAEILEQPLHHGVQPPRPDVRRAFVDPRRDLGDGRDAGIVEDELDRLRRQQRRVLAHERVGGRQGPDVSREGVQRDLLPIVEGSTVQTKHGPVRTDHILFIAAGAFHVAKPSDLIPELQGRFPIRVELSSLSQEDFVSILTEPRNSLVLQYTELLRTEGVELEFEEDGIRALADIAARVNQQADDIGARRLHTVMERLLEDLSFDAPDLASSRHVVDEKFVRERLEELVRDEDLSRYIL